MEWSSWIFFQSKYYYLLYIIISIINEFLKLVNDNFVHTVGLCFLAPGNFRLSVNCKNKETNEMYKCPTHVLFVVTKSDK